jgi:hypothetical protein
MTNDKGKVQMNGKWPIIARGSALKTGAARSVYHIRQSAFGNRHYY